MEKLFSIVKNAGKIILDEKDRFDVHKKGDADFVTKTDIAVQNFIARELSALCPDVDFLSEEAPEHEIRGDKYTWVLDPIDGTMNFIRGLSASVISLALLRGEETELGIVYNPYSDEMFYARRGEGAFLNGKKISVSKNSSLEDSLIAIGTAPYYKPLVGDCFELYRELFLRGIDIRRTGSAAIDICNVAAGRFDCYYEYMLSIWDYAAARLILTEAGGTITNAEGLATGGERKSPVIASNGALHKTVLDLVCKHVYKK